tara:strand:+ start:831 stop:1766 length:936 start_codon:yes stop_codon:yes gene_type:complete
MNILITNPGRRIYFIKFLLDIKKKYKKLKIHTSDCNIFLPTMNIQNIKTHLVPKVKDSKQKYKASIVNIVKKNKIQLILPVTDYDILILASLKKRFKRLGCEIAVPSIEVTRILHNKYKTYLFCKKNNISSPELPKSKNIKKLNKNSSLIEKEMSGSASKNIKVLKKKSKFKIKKNFIYQKFIHGKEIHFDILNDFEGKYITSCVKEKIAIKNGETDIAQIIKKREYTNLAKQISQKIRHQGNLDCDAIVDKKGKVHFLDFNPRFGGGYPFTHLSGMNFIEILINLVNGKRTSIKEPKQTTSAKTLGILNI